jgi:hypothetical protein
MQLTLILDSWRGLAQAAPLQEALDTAGSWQLQPYTASAQDPAYAWLAQRLLQAPARELAALMAGDQTGHYSYEATPCHWQVGLDDVLVAPIAAPTLDEAHALAAAANEALDGAAWLQAVSANHWLVRTRFDLENVSAAQAVGKSLRALLPNGDAQRAYKRILNTVQMAWFTHPVNHAREAHGQLPINAFWMFGGQARKPVNPLPFDAVLGTGLRSEQLARTTGLPLRNALEGKNMLVWIADARDALIQGLPLPASTYMQVLNILRGLPREALIDIYVTDAQGIAHAKRAVARHFLTRVLSGFTNTNALAARLLQ